MAVSSHRRKCLQSPLPAPHARRSRRRSWARQRIGMMADTAGILIEAPGSPRVEPIDERTIGVGPYRLALRRLRRNRMALAFGALFLVLVGMCVLAPVYANDIAHIGPNANNITGTVNVGGKTQNVVSLQGVPIGPTFNSHYFFGAD